MEFELVVRGGLVGGAHGSFYGDVGISDGRVTAVGAGLPEGRSEIDATGQIVCPGAIDVHTHFDHYVSYLGIATADDYESGTRAAAAGGITTIIDFAFQAPGEHPRAAIERECALAGAASHVDFGLHTVVSDLGHPGTLEDLPQLADDGFASVKIFTTAPPRGLTSAGVLAVLKVARENGILVSVHAEDHPLIERLSDDLLRAGRTDIRHLPESRPPTSEALAVARVAAYATSMDAPVYFVHLSSREALDEVRRARSAGGEIFVETRPLYLFLDSDRYSLPEREGNKFACLPPLRAPGNADHLWRALRAGEIQTYATDHASWNLAQKLDPQHSFAHVPAGVSNVQTSMGMLFAEGVVKERISLDRFVALVSSNPAKLFGMWPRKGSLAPGADADLVIFDPNRRFSPTSATLESKADYDPFAGFEFVGWPVLTMSRGEVIARDGRVLSKPGRGELLRRRRFQPL